ncbi:hypothetical protein [Flammeovirga aprica]|uniref:Uncharacterized protein n=1 Tax=Flammeovirga aprica JL-4 TaxID=694437 RepID=A0A7X9XBY3_9BACT|nr:hypothetical protein [Flammeovirga aprica]NME71232.1 hypothetical protein [Flammeovirga aprica JL-4]
MQILNKSDLTSINIFKYEVFKDKEDAIFCISYWYGRSKETCTSFCLDKNETTIFKYIESHNLFIISLFISGIKKSTLLKFIKNYLKIYCNEVIKNKTFLMLDNMILIENYLIEIVVAYYSESELIKGEIDQIIQEIFQNTSDIYEDLNDIEEYRFINDFISHGEKLELKSNSFNDPLLRSIYKRDNNYILNEIKQRKAEKLINKDEDNLLSRVKNISNNFFDLIILRGYEVISREICK